MSMAGNAISKAIVSRCSIDPSASICVGLNLLEKLFPYFLIILLILAVNETVIKPKGNTLLHNFKESFPFLIFVAGWPILFFGLNFGFLLIIIGLLWMLISPKRKISFDSDLLEYFYKQMPIYLDLYKKNKSKTKNEIYIKAFDLAFKDNGKNYFLLLNKNFLGKNSSLNYRKIVRFIIVSKIYESVELGNLLPSIIRNNLELVIECLLLSENESMASKLIEKEFSNEEREEFINYLNETIDIINRYIPNEY